MHFWIHWSRINPLIPNPYELPAGALVFLGVFGFVRRLLPRMTQAHEARADAIDDGLRDAANVSAEAAQVLEQYRTLRAEAQHEAAVLRREAVAQGARYVADQRAEAQLSARRMVDGARVRLEAEYQDAYASVRPDVAELAFDLASRIVGEPLPLS
jgi:F-type H+-transporting ATPase subunit b